jgi:hypothetical protein
MLYINKRTSYLIVGIGVEGDWELNVLRRINNIFDRLTTYYVKERMGLGNE